MGWAYRKLENKRGGNIMDLFVVHNNKAFPSTHALLISPFREIWNNDRSVEKEEAIRIFTYIELLASPKKSNPYFGIPEEDRHLKVKKEVWGDSPPSVENSLEIIKAVEKYKDLLAIASPSFVLFESAMVMAENLQEQIRTFNLNERTRSGSLVLKPKDATNALKDIPDTVKSLELLRARVNQELIEDAKTRNQREIGHYER
jgi:hypothetical protein